MYNFIWNISDIIGWYINIVLSVYVFGGKYSFKYVSSYF